MVVDKFGRYHNNSNQPITTNLQNSNLVDKNYLEERLSNIHSTKDEIVQLATPIPKRNRGLCVLFES